MTGHGIPTTNHRIKQRITRLAAPEAAMYKIPCLIILLLNLVLVQAASAGQVKAYVSAFNVVGIDNKDEMKATLQDLLASRLSGEHILIVDSAAEADIVLTSRYSVAGGMFSIDTVARNSAGNVVARAYEEGDNQSQLIPAVKKLVPKLNTMIFKAFARVVATEPEASATPGAALEKRATRVDVIKEQQSGKNAPSGWSSQRLAGAYTGIAPGKALDNGEREIYIVDGHTLKLYRQGKDLKLLAETSLKTEEQILAIDTADLDGDGVPEVYLTIFNGDALVSQVWTSIGNGLKRVADKLPYYFRSLALNGQSRKIYAQQLSLRSDFFGDVYELARTGAALTLKNPIKLPRSANIYNFNQFTDSQGNRYYVVLNDEGQILVSDQNGEEIWRSKEKFGGSELFFKRQDMADVRYSSEPYRWIFLQQRLVVTSNGEIIVPQNTGSWSIGNKRSYHNSFIHAFSWNGSSLEKKWHTRESDNYVADYYYEPLQQELVTLEVVKHEGMFDNGASIVSIKRVGTQE